MPYEKEKPADGSLDDLLRKREQIDRNIEQQYQKHMAVLFVDIQGSTTLYEQQGDIDGRIFVRRLEEMALPAIAEGEGKLVKKLGDGLLAAFPAAAGAARCANRLQLAVAQNNLKADAAEKFNVRIGLHWGKVLLEESGDVYGDVVNVAARIQGQAEPAQTVVSAEMFRELERADIFCLPVGKAQLKGKKEAIELYLLPWNPRQRYMPTRAVAGRTTAVLRATRREDKLVVTFSPAREDMPPANCKPHEMPFPEAALSECCRRVDRFLEGVNRKGSQREGLLDELREIGSGLFAAALPEPVRNEIRQARAAHLLLQADGALAHVPWEFMHDGDEFISLRFACGRATESEGRATLPGARRMEPPYSMLLVANPTGDLAAAVEEAQLIKKTVTQFPDLRLDTLLDRVQRGAFLAAVPQANILHFSGHTEYERANPAQSRWRFADGAVRAEEILQLKTARALPQIMFVNSCESGRAPLLAEHGLFGLAQAFLAKGVQHYIGALWNIYDQPSRDFAHVFYSRLLEGYSVGDAVRAGRFEVVDKYGSKSLMWASYVLYGDPAATPFPIRETAVAGVAERPAAAVAAPAAQPVAPAPVPALATPAPGHAETTPGAGQRKGIPGFVFGMAATILVAVIAVLAYKALNKTDQNDQKTTRATTPDKTTQAGTQPNTGDNTGPTTQPGTTTTTANTDPAHAASTGSTQTTNAAGTQDPSTTTTALEAELPKNPLIAVLPYQSLDAQDQANAWLGQGLAEAITTDLTKVSSVRVVERAMLTEVLKEIQNGETKYFDPKFRVEPGKLANAGVLVGGSFVVKGGELQVFSRFVLTSTGAVLLTTKHRDKADNLFTLQDAIVRDLIDALKLELSKDEKARVQEAPTASTEAFQQYVRGVMLLNDNKMEEAAEAFRKAAQEDPLFVEAQKSLGDVYKFLDKVDEFVEQQTVNKCLTKIRCLEQALASPEDRPTIPEEIQGDMPWQPDKKCVAYCLLQAYYEIVKHYQWPNEKEPVEEQKKRLAFYYDKYQERCKDYLGTYYKKKNHESGDRNDFYDTTIIGHMVHLHEQFDELEPAIALLKKLIMDFPHLTSEIQGAADQIRNMQAELEKKKEKEKDK
ncbi:MAG: CHAT domain-containing protein [Planctomycetota bacterium]|nr:CHAT domain-containing protein [Planctomycetota bacterium]